MLPPVSLHNPCSGKPEQIRICLCCRVESLSDCHVAVAFIPVFNSLQIPVYSSLSQIGIYYVPAVAGIPLLISLPRRQDSVLLNCLQIEIPLFSSLQMLLFGFSFCGLPVYSAFPYQKTLWTYRCRYFLCFSLSLRPDLVLLCLCQTINFPDNTFAGIFFGFVCLSGLSLAVLFS
jgi:hypothetical protein